MDDFGMEFKVHLPQKWMTLLHYFLLYIEAILLFVSVWVNLEFYIHFIIYLLDIYLYLCYLFTTFLLSS